MSPQKKVTIDDIAAKADVSISTVSRVLNEGAAVTEAKRAAVLEAVAELNYQPNLFAQGLASGHSKTIGVLTPYINSPFYGEIMRGVIQGLEGNGYAPLFAEAFWNPEKEKEAIRTLLARKVDGLIFFAGQSSAEALRQIEKQLPLIIIGRNIPSLATYCLGINDFQGAYTATNHLIEQGHQRIVHITGMLQHQDALDRLEGYKQALIDAGLQADPQLIIEGDFSEKSGRLAVQTLIMRGQTFSAIFSANDQMAYGVRLGLYRQGLRVPDDVSLVGFDDQPGAAYTIPPLTTVHQPTIEMGKAAAQAILKLLKGESFTPPVFKADLVVRESVARYR